MGSDITTRFFFAGGGPFPVLLAFGFFPRIFEEDASGWVGSEGESNSGAASSSWSKSESPSAVRERSPILDFCGGELRGALERRGSSSSSSESNAIRRFTTFFRWDGSSDVEDWCQTMSKVIIIAMSNSRIGYLRC